MTLLRIDVVEPWHAGSGRGDGPGADALVIRDDAGLPYLPGKTLKGLLREALELTVDCGQAAGRSMVDDLFGSTGDAAALHGDRRFTTTEGGLFVGSAHLGRDEADRQRWAAWARGRHELVERLFTLISSTKIDADGVASDQTLRTVQYAVPVTLFAEVEPKGKLPPDWMQHVEAALPLVRSLGTRRNRGFGRCKLRFATQGDLA